jgi:multicomponent K+:H+ antiporter subunit D
VAAAFAMMTKVGLYAVLRISTLMEEYETLGAALFYTGLATLATATVGMLGAKHLARLVGYSVLVSTGILFAALGLRIEALTAPILFYLIVSALTTCTFFMLTGMTDRTRQNDPPVPADDDAGQALAHVAYGIKEPSVSAGDQDAGIAIPAAMAFLGMAFVCCVLLLTGLPPLPGFLAKFALLATALAAAPTGETPAIIWILCAAVLASGLAGLIALSRVGMRLFWSVAARATPRLRLLEAAPVALLIALAFGLALFAAPVNSYLDSAARSLHEPHAYVRAVLSPETPRERKEPRQP